MVKLMLHNGQAFTFGLSGPVGPGGTNLPADVEYVRFGLRCVRQQVKAQGKTNQPRYADFMLITASLPALGGFDRDLEQSIRAFQKSQDLTADGVVSVMALGGVAPSGRPYTQVILESAMRSVFPDKFPRIDMVEDSGPALSLEVAHLFMIAGNPSGKMMLK